MSRIKRGEPKIEVENLNLPENALECMKQNKNFNITTSKGFLTYVANADGTQGILSKQEDGRQWIADTKGNWKEVILP